MNPKLKKLVLRKLKGTFNCYSSHQSSGQWMDQYQNNMHTERIKSVKWRRMNNYAKVT